MTCSCDGGCGCKYVAAELTHGEYVIPASEVNKLAGLLKQLKQEENEREAEDE